MSGYYKNSKKKRTAAAVVLVIVIICMLATMILPYFVQTAGLFDGFVAYAAELDTVAEKTESEAEVEDTRIIPDGISIEGMDVSGLTVSEANALVEDYFRQYDEVEFVFSANDKETTVKGKDLALCAKNKDVASVAASYGTSGNVIERFLAQKAIKHGTVSKDYKLYPTCDEFGLESCLAEVAKELNDEASDNRVRRVDGAFVFEEGVSGEVIVADESAKLITDFIEDDWKGEGKSFELPTMMSQPRGTREELATITDVLGSFTTSYASSSASRKTNVANGVSFINGTVLYPGDEFSVLATITPFTEANGYRLAGSYANGTVVESFGGGICQVSTTLYGAVRAAEVEVVTRSCHSMIIDYVPPSQDAAIAESGAKDFQIKNNKETPIYIEGYCDGTHVYFNIYGKETREDRQVSYETEVLEVNVQPTTFVANYELPLGTMKQMSSGHTGYKARLWKIVKENGVETDRYVYNNSRYQPENRVVHIGVAGADGYVADSIVNAINSQDPAVIEGTLAGFGIAPSVSMVAHAKYQVTNPEPVAAEGETAPAPVEQ